MCEDGLGNETMPCSGGHRSGSRPNPREPCVTTELRSYERSLMIGFFLAMYTGALP